MQEVFKLGSCIGVTVLITGESGTGKELVAAVFTNIVCNGVHLRGNAQIPENLIESELFGHEKGFMERPLSVLVNLS